jgi:hypothetical protein
VSANRAACHLKLENFGSAIADSTEAIKLVRCVLVMFAFDVGLAREAMEFSIAVSRIRNI